MKRNVLLVYLKDLRDLEVARYQLETTNKKEKQQLNQEVQTLNAEISNIQKEDYVDVPKRKWGNYSFRLICSAFFIFLTIGAFGGFIEWLVEYEPTVWGAIVLILSICMCAFFAWVLFPKDGYKKSKADAIKHNQEEQRRLSTDAPKQVQEKKALIQQKTAARNARDKSLFDEYCKVRRLLNSAYSANIIPNQYRNLASIYYIYDYMSTSQATLEETLMHEHMENGIQRILSKLDTIIAQNEEIILNTRCIEANTREISNNTKQMLENEQRMLESMARTEQNTAEAAQAAQISATYSEVNAYFSAATYFSKRR